MGIRIPFIISCYFSVKMSEKENKKSWFIPTDCSTEEFSILLGKDFDAGLLEYLQGFNSTGDHYFILQEDYRNHHHRVYIISFDHEKKSLIKGTLNFDVPKGERLAWFDPASESILFICQRSNESGTFLDLHHFNILDIFGSEYNLKDITVSLGEADITLSYGVNVQLLISLECNLRQKGVTTLVLITITRENLHEDENDIDESPPECFLDILKFKHTEIRHVQRKEIELHITPAFLLSGKYMESQITKDKIYFYNVGFHTGNEFHDPTLEIDEYDYNGKFLHSYTIEDSKDTWLAFADNLVIMNSHKVTHKENAIRIYKLEQGRAHLVKEINDNLICQQKTGARYMTKDPLKMFGYILLPNITIPQGKLILLNVQNGKALNEVTTQGIRFPDFCVNWNLEEFGMGYFKESDTEMYFRILKKKSINSDISLKNLTRLTCLTTFTREYLAQQNIPSILLDYMEIER